MDNSALLVRQEAVEIDGKTWTLARPNYKTRLLFAAFLEKRAIEFARRNRRELAEDYQTMLAAIADRATTGQYVWGGELFASAIGNDDNSLKEAVYLVLVQTHDKLARPEFDQLYVAAGDRLVTAFLAVQQNPTKPPEGPAEANEGVPKGSP